MNSKRWRAAAAAVAGTAVLFGNGGFRRMVLRWTQLRRMNRELGELNREEAELREKLRSARSSTGLERAARKELGYLKPGEVEYRFPPPK